MADLKLGSQIGGNLIWHQGILELNPVDDKLYYQDQEMMTTRGNQTLLGAIKFGTPNDMYDIESMSDGAGGIKRYLRKFRSGATSTIWHETITDRLYTISTGVTDTAPQFTLNNGDSATFQYPVLTNSPQSGLGNALARKDYVDSIDAKNVAKAGDTMSGDLLFNSTARKIRVNEIASITSGWDAAGNSTFFKLGAYDVSKGGDLLEIRAAGAGVGNRTSGFDVRTTKNISNTPLYVGDNMVYHPGNKPTPGDINAYTKSEVDEKHWIRVKDERAAMIAPNVLPKSTMAAYFTNQSDVSSSWVSGFTVNGWDSTYAAWSLFAGSRSDVDQNQLWFKHGRSSWLPSSRIYHEQDKPTNDELNLVSRAGDSMTGVLNMKVTDSMGFGKYSIRMNNGSIGGLNQLVFGDPSDTTSEGIAWPKTGKNDSATTNAEYDLLWALDGDLKFNNKSTYGEWNKPTNEDLNLVSRSGDWMNGKLEIRNAEFEVKHNNVRRVITRLGVQNDAKPFMVLICPKYVGKALPKRGFVGRVTFERGATTSTLQSQYVDISAVTAYTATDAQIHYASYYANVKLVYHTHTDGIEYLALYRNIQSSATVFIDGYLYGSEEMIVISDATGLTVTDVSTRERIYSSGNKPTNEDLNLVSRAGDTITGDLVVSGKITVSKVLLSGAQGTEENALTRKDYVDTKVGTAVQSVTATGAVKSTGGINPVISLVNATTTEDGAMSAADKAKLNGLPAAAVNKTGDSMTGSLTFTNDSQLVWSRNTDWAKIGFKNDSDSDADSYMWFETGDNGNEYFKFRVKPTGSTTSEDVFLIKRNETRSNGRFFVDPSISGSDLITLIGTPNPTGTNARGISGYESTGTTREWGVGAYSENGVILYSYLGFGETPWNNGVKIYADKVVSPTSFNAPDFIQTTPQSSVAGASTRKDYVDTQIAAIDAKNVSKAGDTMTGELTMPKVKSALNLLDKASIRFADLTNTWFHIYSEGNQFKISQGTTAQTNVFAINSNGDMDIAGSTISKYFRTDELGGTNTVAPFASKSSGGSYAAMYTRYAPFHTDVVQTGSSYAPNASIRYTHNGTYAGMYSTGVLCESAGTPGKYTIHHINQSAGSSKVWSFDGSTGRFTADGPISCTNIDVNDVISGENLHLTGNIRLNNSAPTITMQDTDHMGAFLHTNSNNFYVLRSPTANNGNFDSGPGGVHPMTLNLSTGDAQFSRNGSFNDVQIRSDIRLKSNFEPILNAVDKVCTLSGKTFDKVGCDKREAGIIAQDLEKVLPEAIGSFKNTAGEEYLTVSNSGVNALLVEAIKELKAEIEELKSKLN
ncbi:hypothetical protein phiAS5_ORF0113 [Aeromonas phage phiAS5]|uniref:Long tail fiber protein Gp37 n=1 Tax=Aeromonas phage phiAS5 TaxID=879630 RepID=E1A2L0_9CAUD|nr:tail fiber protein [Aeromonas phage phiAS5]ADM79956.1 hypothetical protein phiAS5_ORF0113 [Aeromonas phage phiAS5]